MERTTKQTIVIGYNNTGKSTLVAKIIASYTATPQRKALIVTPDPVEWIDVQESEFKSAVDFDFSGVRKYVWNDDDKISVAAMKRIKKYYSDGILIFDDCRGYLDATTPPWLKYFYIRRRQRMIDLMLVGHGFTDIPPKAFTNCSDLFLFLTKDNFSTRKKDLVNYDQLLEYQQKVNAKALDTKRAWTKSGKIDDNIHYFERIKF